MASSDNANHIEMLKDNENFMFWKFQITIVFKANDLYDIVNGTVKLEECKDATTKTSWQKNDARAQKFIVLCCNFNFSP